MDWRATEYTLPHFINNKYTFIHRLFRIIINVACLLLTRPSTAIGTVSLVQNGSQLEWLFTGGRFKLLTCIYLLQWPETEIIYV